MPDDDTSTEVIRTRDTRPVPDPTKLTNEAVAKAVSDLKELFQSQLTAVDKDLAGRAAILVERLSGMDKAIALIQTISDRVPDLITSNVATLRELHSEKFDNISSLMEEQFKGVQTQFRERDTRTEQSSKDSKVAVDAALQAAKEAVGEQTKSQALAIAKSEAATDKRLDQIVTIMNATTNGLNDKIDDIKASLAELRRLVGLAPQVPLQQAPTPPSSPVMAYVAAGIGLVLILALIFAVVATRTGGAA